MKIIKWGFLAVLGLAACDRDATEPREVVPYAQIQWVNAVSDTGKLDYRVVDIVSNAGLFGAEFRGSNMFPQPIEAGSRRVRVFMNGENPAIASDVVWDTTATLDRDVGYVFVLHGFSRAGLTPALQAEILTRDAPATVPAGQFAVRVLNVAPGLDPDATAPVDAWVVPRAPGALAGTPTITSTAFRGRSTYAMLDTGTYRIAFTATGTTSPALFQAHLPRGVASQTIAGTAAAGSALTVVIVPRSLPTSQAPFPFTGIQGAVLTSSPDSTVTAVTAAAHGLATGDSVIINGADTAIYNGSFEVTVVDPTTFTYPASRTTTGSPATGYPFWLGSGNGPSFNGRPVSRLTAVGTTATMVTVGNHGLATNDVVTISGAAQPEYNGSFVVTVVNATTFTYTANGAPAASPATGTPVYRAGTTDYTRPNVFFLVDRRPN